MHAACAAPQKVGNCCALLMLRWLLRLLLCALGDDVRLLGCLASFFTAAAWLLKASWAPTLAEPVHWPSPLHPSSPHPRA